MAVLKCKMCGGTMEMTSESVAVCEFCGTKQTVPTVQDLNLQGLFNRANTLRIKCEFDKAEQLYEKIITVDNTLAEAYWGLILCKYGIEYVEDPTTFKRIPTCHRASFDSIIADEDYNCAIDFADAVSQKIYETEAREIDRLQKEILKLSQKEEPYDVFICYKETDDTGKRTQDSVIANDIYYQLKQEGFKVFYAAITLEDKLGSAYEPCIFAALNSSKVMLAIGTKPEYFNAVWVKNEWSRYLKIMKKDRTKLLIPCYRDMDAYELPDEFAHLQAQDMSKIGFINDVVRGIKKVIVKEDKPNIVKESIVTNSNTNIAPLMERVFMFLEDGDWESADEYCEKVLDQNPKFAMAYLGKLMAELEVSSKDELKDCSEPFDDSNNYSKAIRFGDAELISFLESCTATIKEQNELNKLNQTYDQAKSILDKAETVGDIKRATEMFNSISDFKDSQEQLKIALEKAEDLRKDAIYREALRACNTGIEASFRQGIALLETIRGWKDVDELLDNKDALYVNTAKKNKYLEAKRRLSLAEKNIEEKVLASQTLEALEEIKELFSEIIDWEDSLQQVEVCEKYIQDCKKEVIRNLETQKKLLEIELNNIKGLFVAKERAELLKSIAAVNEKIQKMR